MRFAFFVCLFVCTFLSYSYPSFIGYGYKSCRSCHFNALGNGPLTDYGRIVGATMISANLFGLDDETLAKRSSFFMSGDQPKGALRFSGDIRGLYFKKTIEKNQSEARFIPMQADFSVIYKSQKEKFIALMTLGYIPPEKNTSTQEDTPLISREHYLSYAFSENFRAYLGFLDVAYGLRIVEHTAFSRTSTSLAQNDQVHGLMLSYSKDKFDLAIHPFAGNLMQEAELRQAGASIFFEHDIGKKFRLGASALYSFSEFRKRLMSSVHFKWGLEKGSSLIAELGFVQTSLASASEATLGNYFFMQNDFSLAKGVSLLFTSEIVDNDLKENGWTMRVGPGFRYYPFQRLELRADLYSTTLHNFDSLFDENSLDFLFQVHLWL